MGLKIETFNNKTGGFSAFKAIGHPLVMEKAVALIDQLAAVSYTHLTLPTICSV